MVSLISEDPPMLNWIYVDRDTHAVEFGGRKDTLGHVIGPWGWSDDEHFVTLEGQHETFVAVKEEDENGQPRWVAYWDPDGKILADTAPTRCRPVKLRRKMQLGMESSYVRD